MALITCPECQKEVSDTCDTCPHCGYKLKEEKFIESIATANVTWTKELNDKFQKIHFNFSKEKKLFIIFTIVFTVLGVLPGIYYVITFLISRKTNIKRIWKNTLKNTNGQIVNFTYDFGNESFYVNDNMSNATLKYVDLGKIVLSKECITFFLQSMNQGFCVPLENISDQESLINVVKELPNFVKTDKL